MEELDAVLADARAHVQRAGAEIDALLREALATIDAMPMPSCEGMRLVIPSVRAG